MDNESFAEHDDTIERYALLQELGGYYVSVGDYAQAEKCYGKTAVMVPDEPNPYVGLGVIALQKNLFDDAELAFKVAIRLGNDCSSAYAGLAMAAEGKGNYKKAFDMYLKCLELDTNNLTALLGMFQVSCQMGSFAEVIHYLEVYLEMHPDDRYVKLSVAALYVKQGRFEESRGLLLAILAGDEGNKDAANLLEEVEHNLARIK